jgi:hypothetical protein
MFSTSRSSLCLAGTGDARRWVGGGGVAVAVELLWVDLAIGESCNIWDLSILERTSCLSASWSLSVLLVRCEVEGDEQEEVRAENTHTGECGEFLTGALSVVWKVWEVGGGEVGV